jgi:hypothetical protein
MSRESRMREEGSQQLYRAIRKMKGPAPYNLDVDTIPQSCVSGDM